MFPLKNKLVLDLSRVLAGPYTSMLLSEYGAQVIKVERPITGDDTRTWGPPFDTKNHNLSCYFESINKNKLSIAIDMRKSEGQKIIQELAQKSDILLENLMPGALKKYDLDFESISKLNDSIIYASLSGYGDTGPYKNRGGYDVIASSITGFMGVTGTETQPVRPGVAISDISTALFMHGAILAALLSREQDQAAKIPASPVHIKSNLLAAQLAVNSYAVSNFLNAGKVSQRWTTGHPSIVPYQSFQCQDGVFFTIGAGNELQYGKLLKCLDQIFENSPENLSLIQQLKSEKFNSNSKRVEYRDEVVAIFSEIFSQKTSKFWNQAFEHETFPFGVVNSMDQVFEDPQIQHLDLVETCENSSIRVVKHPVTFGPENTSDNLELLSKASRPPLLGEHTKQVLENYLNYDEYRIQKLIDQKVIECADL